MLPFAILIIAIVVFPPLYGRLAVCMHRSAPWKSYVGPVIGICIVWCACLASYLLADRHDMDSGAVHGAPVMMLVVPLMVIMLGWFKWLQHSKASKQQDRRVG